MDVCKRIAAGLITLALWLFPITPVSADCTGTWGISDGGSYKAWLEDISMADATHGWAVGYRLDGDGNEQHRLLSWDGSGWSNATPAVLSYTSWLTSVWAIGPDDAWASGKYQDEVTSETHALALHWDGADWTQVPLPQVESPRASALWASAGDDVWIAGTRWVGDRYGAMILHYDGQDWAKVHVPNPPSKDRWLWGIHGSSPDDIWAVGSEYDLVTAEGRPLTLHWDGAEWRRVPIGPVRITHSNTTFMDVFAVSTDEAWAVGHRNNTHRLLMQRWNGTAWQNVKLPALDGYQVLEGVTMSSSGVVAVGSAGRDPLILRREGTTWIQDPLAVKGALTAITSLGGSDWAAGAIDRSSLIVTRCT